MKPPSSFIDQFSHQTIAVIGDVMLDQYIYGHVERISPEAPIPIVQQHEVQLVPGGAGNTAANITALGATCHLFGLHGNDKAGKDLEETLHIFGIKTDGLIKDNRPTTVKTRVLGNHQQIVRIDHELNQAPSQASTDALCNQLKEVLPQCQAIVVCDYAKGAITRELMDYLRDIAVKLAIPLLVDPRPHHKAWYHHVTFLTPNKKETSGMVQAEVRDITDAKEQGIKLARELQSNILLTMSEEGMLVIDAQLGTVHHLPTKAQEVVDVSGAGDTVIATLALGLAAQAAPEQAAELATHAASVVVAKLGTATLTQEELRATF